MNCPDAVRIRAIHRKRKIGAVLILAHRKDGHGVAGAHQCRKDLHGIFCLAPADDRSADHTSGVVIDQIDIAALRLCCLRVQDTGSQCTGYAADRQHKCQQHCRQHMENCRRKPPRSLSDFACRKCHLLLPGLSPAELLRPENVRDAHRLFLTVILILITGQKRRIFIKFFRYLCIKG